MHVSEITATDHATVARIAHTSGLVVDVQAELARSWARCLVARETPESSVVGFLVAWVVSDELHVIHVATAPEARRRGVGRALLRGLLELGRTTRSRLVLLEVRRSNDAAIGLYRSLGFRAIGVRRGYYADTGEDAVEMILTLDPTTGLVHRGPDEVQLEESA